MGSAVMSPMIFEKALSMARNVAQSRGKDIRDCGIHVVDLQPESWDWSAGEPPMDNPAYYLRFMKTFNRMDAASTTRGPTIGRSSSLCGETSAPWMANSAMPSIDYAFGFDIGGTKTVASLWRLSGELVGKEGFATRGTWREVLGRAAAIAEGLRDREGIPREEIAGIGISCGGPLDSARGLVLSPPNLPGWDEVPIACFLEERLGAKAW